MMKKLLLAALAVAVLASVSTADAQSQPWQKVHGYVKSIQGTQMTVKADDGRLLTVDVSQVSESVRRALAPGEGVTLSGFEGAQSQLFTARFIQQDSSDVTRGGVVRGQPTTGKAQDLVGVIPQFLASQEFQAAGINVRDPGTAATIVRRLYRSFFERRPAPQEVQGWVDRVVQSGDLRAVLEAFMTSPEYTAKGKGIDQGLVDLYESVLGRIPSQTEIEGWKQRLAQR